MKKLLFIISIYLGCFYAYSQDYNFDFEDWDTVTIDDRLYEIPSLWTCNYYDVAMERTTDASSENYAIKIWTWYIGNISVLYLGAPIVSLELDYDKSIIKQSGLLIYESVVTN